MKKKYLILCRLQAFIIITSVLLFSVTAQSQDLTDAQRQERCQNNKIRIAELVKQVKEIDDKLEENSKIFEEFFNDRTAIRKLLMDYALKYDEKSKKMTNEGKSFGICANYISEMINWMDEAFSVPTKETGVCPKYYELLEQKESLKDQLTSHRTNLVALGCDNNTPPSNISGTWIVKQGSLTGTLTLSQSGTTLSGAMNWDGHEDGTLKTGSYINGKVMFVLSYPTGFEGTYSASVDGSGKKIGSGTTSSTTGAKASWSGTKK